MPLNATTVFFDLDETIYDETTFRSSGFNEIASFIEINTNYNKSEVLAFINQKIKSKGWLYRNLFQDLVSRYGIETFFSIEDMIDMFRNHTPNIKTNKNFDKCIRILNNNFITGIITEGLRVTQINKIIALQLYQFFDKDNILITDALSKKNTKRDPYIFELAAKITNSKHKQCVYIGDNPVKDFVAAFKLGWTTIRLKRGLFKDIPSDKTIVHEVNSYEGILQILL